MSESILYPALSSILPLEKIPGGPDGIAGDISSVFEKIYVKDFIASKSFRGDNGFYDLKLVSFKSLGIDIPIAEDLRLVLNPSIEGTTEIPVSFSYSWQILRYLNDFSFASFNDAVDSLINILFDLLQVEPDQLLRQAIIEFYPPQTGIADFISAFNTQYTENLQATPGLSLFDQIDALYEKIEEDVELDIVEVINEVILKADPQALKERLQRLFSVYLDDIDQRIDELIKLNYSASINEISAGIQFPRKWLVPVYTGEQAVEGLEINDPLPESYHSLLKFNAGRIVFSDQNALEFDQLSTFSFTKSQIGNTGMLVEFGGLKLDLSNTNNIPEAIADGRPDNFKGVYAEHAAITLPEKWFSKNDQAGTTAEIVGSNFLIGTGGVSGTVALRAVNPAEQNPKLIKKIGQSGFEVSFTSFDVTFKQGKVVSSNIVGGLKIPKLKDGDGNDAEIEIVGSFNENGDFSITASEKDGFAPLEIKKVLKLYIYSLEVGSEDGKLYLGVSGQMALTNPTIEKLFCDEEQRIPLPNMRIYEDGSFEIVGGQVPMPSSFRLCLGPVDISVTGINQGSYQREHKGVLRKYNYWGFDGSISVDPLGIEARGDGIKYYYTVDDGGTYVDTNGVTKTKERHTYIRVQTIGIDLMIPGNVKPEAAAAIISGYLSIPEPGESPEYEGGVSVSIPKTGLNVTADMRLAPKHPAFILDASVTLATPLLIGSTGLAFTGFRGLIGYRYVAEKEAIGLKSGEDTWYDYYVHPKRGINLPKFSGPNQSTNYKNPVSIGAGATITAAIPNVLSVRAMFLFSIPSLFILDGKGSILAPEYGLDDTQEPPFFAFLAVGDSSIEIGMGADLKLPRENGEILALHVAIEMAFFFKNPKAWYINVGTKEKPNQARILSILDGKAYLQISAKGIEAGARVELSIDKKFGPVRFKAWLFGEVGGKISFERFQIGGYLELGGGFEASLFGAKLGASFNALFAVEAPKPFLIIAKLRLCVKIKIAFVRVKKCLEVKIKWEKSKELDTSPIRPLAPADEEEFVKAVHMLTGEGFDLLNLGESYSRGISALNNAPILPLDSYIDIKFSKPLLPNAVSDTIGGVNNAPDGYTELIPPEKNVKGGKTIRQVKHTYSIEKISLEAWNGTGWVPYDPYASVTAKEAEAIPELPANLKLGHWQKDRKEYDKIRLLASNPFTFAEKGEPGTFIPEELGITASTLFCEGQERAGRTINWLNRDLGTRFYVPSHDPDHYYRKEDLYFQIGGTFDVAFGDRDAVEYGEIAKSYSNFDYARSLKIENTNTIALKFPNDVREVTLKLSSTAQGVFFRFYKAVVAETDFLEVEFELLPDGEVYKASPELYQEVIFSSEEPIAKVVIDPKTANEDLIADLREQIAALFEDSYDNTLSDGEVEITIREPKDRDAYDLLISQLEEARNEGCRMGFAPPRGIGAMQIKSTLIVGEDAFGENPDVTPPATTETCATFLHEVNWLSVIDYEYNVNIPGQDAISEDFTAGLAAVTKVADPILRPETKYLLSFTLKDTVNNGDRQGAWDYHYGFQTGKPLGHYHLDDRTNYGRIEKDGQIIHDSVINPDKYPLTSLRTYIDYKRSYPNANGSLLNAKPLYYGTEGGGNELRLFFTRPYLYHMLDSWGAYNGLGTPEASMQILIKDPVEKVTFSNPPKTEEEIREIPGGTSEWTEDLEPRKPKFIQFYEKMLDKLGTEDGAKCIVLPGDAIIPKSFERKLVFENLKPQKMYTAIVNGIYEGQTVELHNYVFQTSRYKNFAEQINSYLLTDEAGNSKQALFEIDLDVSTEQLAAAYSNAIGKPDALSKARETQEADLFDRTINGLLKLPALPPAVTTELNVLRNKGGKVVGLLLRSPEPFNDPKIPLNVIKDTKKDAEGKNTLGLGVVTNTGVNSAFKTLYAKDFSQILVMRYGININVERLKFKFQYLLWNGSNYVTQDAVVTENFIINQ
ncbi:MAG: hypothetical protein AAFQ98_02295 [Bacteroidota bacterium]